MSKIEIKDLYLIFGHEKQKALKMLKKDKSKEEILKDTGCTVGVKDANLSINEGEFFVIMGLSGSGKSTLLRCINRLIRPTAGQVLVNGVDISKISEKELLQVRRKELAMVFFCQLYGYVLAERGRAFADIHGHIQYGTFDDAYQLALCVWRFLKMKTAQYAVTALTFIVLYEMYGAD